MDKPLKIGLSNSWQNLSFCREGKLHHWSLPWPVITTYFSPLFSNLFLVVAWPGWEGLWNQKSRELSAILMVRLRMVRVWIMVVPFAIKHPSVYHAYLHLNPASALW